jgi:UTP--glucose-1-phosphate uridylyltransferase
MRARTAVIPAAGMGTRFRPVTHVVPKELLPIVDTPALQFVVDEAVGAGIEHLVVVTSHRKPAIEQYCALLDEVRVTIAYQDEPKGLGHAVHCAAEAVGDEPFAVLLPDEIMGDSELLRRMIDTTDATAGSVVGLLQVPREQVSAYGVVVPSGPMVDDVVPLSGMVEKPPVDEAPSELIIIGRYLLTPDVFGIIADLPPGRGGEIQLTDALAVQAATGPFHGVMNRSTRHDTGTPFGWFTTVVDMAVDHPVIGAEVRAWLARSSTT